MENPRPGIDATVHKIADEELAQPLHSIFTLATLGKYMYRSVFLGDLEDKQGNVKLCGRFFQATVSFSENIKCRCLQ